MATFVGAIDQGTTSSRFVLFDRDGRIAAIERREHRQITPRAGWVEHDAREIWQRTRELIDVALGDGAAADIAAIGITNQRETAVIWDRETGEPIHNAIVWQDTRTDALVRELAGDLGPDRLRDHVGLPLSTYFSGPKIAWILDHIPGARERAENGELLFGTIDTWLLWNLTGGAKSGVHATDVTNASRTLLMDLRTLDWHEPSLELIGVPRALLPEIRSSSESYGEATVTAAAGRPVAGILGDQQAALFGQACFSRGEAKNTYGTGSFLLVNTGEEIVSSDALLTSVGYQLGDAAPSYVLEGSIAVTGAAVQWLRDGLGLISATAEVEGLARTVEDYGTLALLSRCGCDLVQGYFIDVPRPAGELTFLKSADGSGTSAAALQEHDDRLLARVPEAAALVPRIPARPVPAAAEQLAEAAPEGASDLNVAVVA